jgi:uncharacterized membrane-anchored protein
MSTRQLLEELAQEGLVDPEVLDETTPAGLRAREALSGLTGEGLRLQKAGASVSVWLGALLMALFLVVTEVTRVVPVGVALGLAGLGMAAALARGQRSLLENQLRWIGTIGGQTLILASLANVLRSEAALWLTTLALQALTLALVPNLAINAAAVFVAGLAVMGLFQAWGAGALGHDLSALLFGACTCALWAFEAPLAVRLGRLWQPLAYALPLVLWVPLTVSVDRPGEGVAAAALGWAALSTWLIGQAGRERPELRGKAQLAGWIGVWLTAALGLDAPGISAGLTLLLLGQLRASLALRALGLVAIGGFLFFWYYELSTTLLQKSATAVGHGVVFLLLARLLRRSAARPREHQHRPLAARIASMRWLTLALGVGLAIPAYVVVQKERVVAAAETVLLPLAPVDPRSLIQGDYMTLRYALVSELPNVAAMAPRGALVITRDADGVASFVRVDDGRPLAPGELRLRYAKRGTGVSLGAETFLFPEGEGPTLAGARYGELALAESGDSVLIGLRDGDKRPLGTRLHERR